MESKKYNLGLFKSFLICFLFYYFFGVFLKNINYFLSNKLNLFDLLYAYNYN